MVRKFDAPHDDRVLLTQHVVEHLTRVEHWRIVLCDAPLSVADGFEANGDEQALEEHRNEKSR